MNSQWIDLSVTLDEFTLSYPGDPVFKRKPKYTFDKNQFQLEIMETGMHLGTHVDSPLHFLENGKSVDEIEIDKVIGNASKISVLIKNGVILTKDIEDNYKLLRQPEKKLIIETSFSKKMNTLDYYEKCPSFEVSFLDFLKKNQIELIGLDLPTVKYVNENPFKAHIDILTLDIVIVENLIHLELLKSSVYLVCLPLKLKGFDASLIRAIAKNNH